MTVLFCMKIFVCDILLTQEFRYYTRGMDFRDNCGDGRQVNNDFPRVILSMTTD